MRCSPGAGREVTGFLAAFLPRFRLDRCGIDTERQAAVLVAVAQGGERVLTVTPLAYTENVRVGMTLAEARSHCPQVVVERLDAEAEMRDREGLAACLQRFSPDVRVAPPDAVLLHGRADLLAPVRQALVNLGHAARLVWAPLREVALVLARHSPRDRVLRVEDQRSAVGELSISVMARRDPRLFGLEEHLPILEVNAVQTLTSAGIRTLASLGSLPASSLTGRFGRQILPAWALARGAASSGDATESVAVLPKAPAERQVECEFPEPVDNLDALMFVLHGLLRDVAASLEERGEAVTRLIVRLRLEQGALVVPVRLGTPGRSPDRVFKLLRLRFERVRLESPVVAIGVEVAETCVWRPGQGGLFDRADREEPLADLIARLQDALGKEAVVRPVLANRHRPEAAWTAVPEGDAAPKPIVPPKRDPAMAHEPGGEEGQAARPRPTLLLPEPLPVRVIATPSGRPRALGGLIAPAGIPGGTREWVPVTGANGPERLSGEWWMPAGVSRDYWVCTLEDGRIAWVYRDGDSDRWLLHGWFDGGREVQSGPRVRSGNGAGSSGSAGVRSAGAPLYAELICRSNFSFCEGASFPAELVEQAKALGLAGLALTDRDGLYGAVQAHRAAKKAGFPLTHGALLTVREGDARRSVAVLVQNRKGWSSLCRLLTAGRFEGHDTALFNAPRRVDGPGGTIQPAGSDAGSDPEPLGYRPDKVWAELPFERLLSGNEGLVVMLRGRWPGAVVGRLQDSCGDRLYQAVSRRLDPDEAGWIEQLRAGEVPCVATNDVLMHTRERGRLQDVLTCIRLGVTLPNLGQRAQPNTERALIEPRRMLARFAAWPDMIERTLEIQARCTFSLDELKYQYPREVVPAGYTAQQWLEELTRRGMHQRYRGQAPEEVKAQVVHELDIIGRLNFASYFLTVHDMVRFARTRDILCQGRGSAANSAVCYVLGVTPVDPARQKLLFERFISEERGEPPDIDIDFEHERREEVLQYVYNKYGRDRAAMVNEVIAWRGKMAVRDVGKALGFGPDAVDQLAKTMGHFDVLSAEEAGGTGVGTAPLQNGPLQNGPLQNGPLQNGPVHEPAPPRTFEPVHGPGGSKPRPRDNADAPDPKPPGWALRLREAGVDLGDSSVEHLIQLATQIQGFPRHTSIHVGGFVISDDPLIDTAPIEPARMDARTVLQWDKNDIDDLGFVKVDMLALGMLTAIRKAFRMIQSWHGRVLDLTNIPTEDPSVYTMLGHADSIGVFQIESRAQQSMLPRLRPRNFYDLVVETAIVRPGPIQGGMVHPYLRRRSGEEPITYADERLRPILERTMGVPIFQEQVMAMAVAVGGFTPGEADQLRRAMGAWRKRGGLHEIGERLMDGMRKNGITPEYAEQIFKQIQGFAEYGFPESHAASFAHLVYVSSWLRCHYPAAFTAALINSQPMGFYAPRSLIADSERHGVTAREVDVTVSCWDCTMEGGVGQAPDLRLGLRLIRGFRVESAERLVQARREAAFTSLADLRRRAGLGEGELGLLARADALRTLLGGADRRAASWAVSGLWPGLFAPLGRKEECELPAAAPTDEVLDDYASTGLSLRQHPVGLMRPQLARRGFTTLGRLPEIAQATVVRVAGLVSHRQRPATASGVVFLTLEDETGSGNIVVWPKVYDRQRSLVRGAQLVEVYGKLERTQGSGGPDEVGDVLNVIAWNFAPLSLGTAVAASSRDFR